MEADKKELYQRLEKLLNTQDLDKWEAEKTKPRIDEVVALVKRAVQENKEKSLVYDELQELKPFFISYPSEQLDEYLRTIRSKTTSLDGICLLQVILPAKKLPSYQQATDKAIKKAEVLIKKISKATGCNAETAGFLTELLIQSICHTTYYLYNQELYINFQNKSTEIATKVEAVLKQVTEPIKDKKNDRYYNERDRLMVDLNKVINDLFASMYNYNKADRIAAGIISKLYPEQEITQSIATISTFRKMYQSNPTNQLARVELNIQKATKNTITDTARIEDKGFHVIIEQYSQIQNGIRPSAKLLLDAIITKFTEAGNETSTEVRLPLKEYMEMRGRKDLDEAREQANYDLAVLSHIQIPVQKDLDSEPVDMNICSYKNRIERGVIVFAFNPYFVKAVKDYWSVMSYPAEMLQVNTKKNPNTYNLFRRICEHKRMNYGRKNADRIGVKTLLEACPNIPKYEAVKDIGGIEQRIIKPFERDLDVINAFKWNYCGKNGAQIDIPASYDEFEKANIKIIWGEYPSQKIKPAKAKKKTNTKQ